MTEVSILIVNYNSGARLKQCLDCLQLQTFKNFETIIIDNASTDDSVRTAQNAHPDIQILHAGSNLGFAAANNLAAQSATGNWLAFLNPDAYAKPDWLEKLIVATRKYPSADAFGSTQLDANDPARIDGSGDVFHVLGLLYRGHYGQSAAKIPSDGECFSPCAAAALYRRRVFEELGGFDESFFCYGEDVDLGARLRLAGGYCIQVSDAVVLHEGSGITGRYSEFTTYYGNRNRIWLTYKNIPDSLYFLLIPFHAIVNLFLFFRFWRIGLRSAYWRALKDGYCRLNEHKEKKRTLQRNRKISVQNFARMMTWSPLKIFNKDASLRPIRNHDENPR